MNAFSRHFGWLARLFRRGGAVPAAKDEARPFVVVLAALAGDEGEAAAAVAQALAGRKGLLERRIPAALALDDPSSHAGIAAALGRARQILAEESADLVVWGSLAGKAMTLFFTAHADEDGPPLAFALAHRLELPMTVDAQTAEVVYAAVLTALEPKGQRQRSLLDESLPAVAGPCDALAKRPPANLAPRQQASVMAAFGRVAAAMAVLEPAADWLGRADAAFLAAHRRLPRDRHPLDEALLSRQRATVLATMAERCGDEAAYEAAIAAHHATVAALPRAEFPIEWAAEQWRLGLALYRFDLKTGRTDLLKDAIGCFQAALHVFSRNEWPRRWPDIMNALAQALQVYGDASKSVEILDKAVAACRSVLDVRRRESDPLGWAATMNTLGTALFLRDKHADESDHLEEASDALNAAAAVYHAHGLTRLAALAEKNMGHVERLSKTRRERPARFDWASEE